jgi:hypothetical protein
MKDVVLNDEVRVRGPIPMMVSTFGKKTANQTFSRAYPLY